MADYVPNTVVKILQNVPLDDTYTDTRWFSSVGDQTGFFNGKAKYTFTDLTYQRVNNGIAQPRVALTCRVPMIADNLYDCNYMMFQNTNYGSKWFYAFIKQVNYINPNNTEIVYEIDYLQSFMFELSIKASFVEREHASADEDKPFANLTPEPLQVPNWTYDQTTFSVIDMESMGLQTAPTIVMALVPSSLTTALFTPDGEFYSGIYSGAYYKTFTTAAEANAFIVALAAIDAQDSIVDVFMSPGSPKASSGTEKKSVTTAIDVTGEVFTTPTGTYTIRNKKLLNSQFTYIYGNSHSGEEMTWLPEYVNGTTFAGEVHVAYNPEFAMMFVPRYMGSTDVGKRGIDYGLPFNQVVHCTWNSMGYLGSAIKGAVKVAGVIAATVATGGAAAPAALSTAVGPAAPAAIGPTMSGAMQTGARAVQAGTQLGDLSEIFDTKGQSSRGSPPTDILTFAMGLHGFDFRRMCPDKETLERFDTFFDMFGYQVNKVKVPNLDTRVAWNYVKLNRPCIYGSVPVEGMAVIRAAFSRGIRLWHVDAVGDYSIQNPPK